MTKLEEKMNEFYSTEDFSLTEQIKIIQELPVEDANEEFVKLLQALNVLL
ncbi:hypothetical protein [Halobacillus litoralis]|nr:hypothetical protein [Halobacillus litoralis]MCA1021513.1 hypothetical protein [Halobacillus litoralis]